MEMSDRPLRLGVMLSGSGTTLENLFEKIRDQTLNAVVTVVISSNAKAYGLTRASQRLVPTYVVRLKRFRDHQEFSHAITAVLKGHSVDLVVMAGFMTFYQIPPCFEGKVMNIHPALIPKYCGKGFYGHHVHEAVVAAGETESGCTVHFADSEYDHGPIILQRKITLDPHDTPDEVAAKVFKEECIAYPEAIRMYMEGKARMNATGDPK